MIAVQFSNEAVKRWNWPFWWVDNTSQTLHWPLILNFNIKNSILHCIGIKVKQIWAAIVVVLPLLFDRLILPGILSDFLLRVFFVVDFRVVRKFGNGHFEYGLFMFKLISPFRCGYACQMSAWTRPFLVTMMFHLLNWTYTQNI